MMLCFIAPNLTVKHGSAKPDRAKRGKTALNLLRFLPNKIQAESDFPEPLPESRSSTSADDELVILTFHFHYHTVVVVGLYFFDEIDIDNVTPIDSVKNPGVKHDFKV